MIYGKAQFSGALTGVGWSLLALPFTDSGAASMIEKHLGRPFLTSGRGLPPGDLLRSLLRKEKLFRDGGPILVGDLVGEVVDGDAAVLRERSGRHRDQALQAARRFFRPPAG